MKKYLALLIALLIAGPALASNMGFKLKKSVSVSNRQYWVSLPTYNSYTTASTICDVGSTEVSNCTEIGRYNTSTGLFESWADIGGFFDGTDFTLQKGQAIYVITNSPANWIIVGSNDDSFSFNFNKTNDRFWIGIPYHKKYTSASAICDSSGPSGGIANCSEIGRFNSSTGLFESWADIGGFFDGTDFSVTAGEGVYVIVTATQTWSPSHY